MNYIITEILASSKIIRNFAADIHTMWNKSRRYLNVALLLLTSAMHHPKTLIEVEQELLHLTIVN